MNAKIQLAYLSVILILGMAFLALEYGIVLVKMPMVIFGS